LKLDDGKLYHRLNVLTAQSVARYIHVREYTDQQDLHRRIRDKVMSSDRRALLLYWAMKRWTPFLRMIEALISAPECDRPQHMVALGGWIAEKVSGGRGVKRKCRGEPPSHRTKTKRPLSTQPMPPIQITNPRYRLCEKTAKCYHQIPGEGKRHRGSCHSLTCGMPIWRVYWEEDGSGNSILQEERGDVLKVRDETAEVQFPTHRMTVHLVDNWWTASPPVE